MGTGGKRSYGHEVPVGRIPRRSFGDFPIAGKVTRRPHCARRRVSERNRRASGGSSRGDGGEIPL